MPDLSVFRDARCYPHPMPRHEEYPQLTPRHEEYPQPSPRYEEYLQSTPRQEYPYPIPRHEEYPLPTPRYEEYPHPSPRNKEHTTLKDYLTQIFTKPSISYPYANPSNVGYPNDLTTLNLNRDLDQTFLGQDGELTKLGHFNRHTAHNPTKKGQCDPKSSCLFPKKQPDVKIYPNAEPNHKILDVLTQNNANLNSNSRERGLEYLSHPSLRNENYPFEEFLQNYWQTNANPFKPFLR